MKAITRIIDSWTVDATGGAVERVSRACPGRVRLTAIGGGIRYSTRGQFWDATTEGVYLARDACVDLIIPRGQDQLWVYIPANCYLSIAQIEVE